MLFHKRRLYIFITLFSQDKFKCLSVLSLLLFIYFFPKNSSSGAQSHSVFPSQCLLSLPRAAAPMEIGEHQHPQMQQLHTSLGRFPGGSRSNGNSKGRNIKSPEEANRGTRPDGFVLAGTACFLVVATGCLASLSLKH